MLRKKRFSFLITKTVLIMFLLTVFLPVLSFLFEGNEGSQVMAAEGYTVSDAVYKAVNYYVDNNNTLEHWEETLALSRLGVDLKEEKWSLPPWETTNPETVSEYVGAIIGLISTGKDSSILEDVASGLIDKQNSDGSFGSILMDTYWAIIALEEAKGDYNKEAAIDYLVNQQNEDGGFSWDKKGETSGPDTTGAALCALAYHKDQASDAINKAIEYLHSKQLETGGFAYSDDVTNPSSTAYTIIGLVASNEDITDAKWIKNNKTMIDSLIDYQREDGSFSASKGGPFDRATTRQALLALSYLKEKYASYIIDDDKNIPSDPEIKSEIRVRIEGRTSTLFDDIIEVTNETTGIDLLRTAIGAENVPGEFITHLLGETAIWDEDLGRSEYWGIYTIANGQLTSAAVGIAELSIEGIDELLLHFQDGFLTNTPKVNIEQEGLTTKFTVEALSWGTVIGVVEGATLTINGETYTTNASGQVSVELPAGTYTARVEKQGEIYPELIRYDFKFLVQEAASPGEPGVPQQPKGISVQIAVVGKDGEVLVRPTTINLANNSSVLDALSKLGVSYKADGGYVREIAGQKERELGGQSGWKFKVNSTIPEVSSDSYQLSNNDRVIWWYAKTATEPGPSWGELIEASRTGTPLQNKVPEKTGDELVKEQLTKGKEIVISLEERADSFIVLENETINKIIESNKPLVIKNAGAEVHFELQDIATEEISKALANENSQLKIEVKEIGAQDVKALLEEIKAQEAAKLIDIGGKIYEFSFKISTKQSDGSVIEEAISHFANPLPIKIDLSQARLNPEDLDNLTGIRYRQDEQGNYIPVKLGGTYNPKDKVFTFYTNSFSFYGVMQAEELTKISLGINSLTTKVNGKRGWTDVAPMIMNNRTMVPIRMIAETLGAEVEWLAAQNTVTIEQEGKVISLAIGELLPGLDTPATIINGRTMVPLRYISENLGATVTWFGLTETIEIVK